MAEQSLLINKHYAGQYIQGQRNYQEDDFSFDNSQPEDFLMVVADGLGGHQGGAYASRCAVQTFTKQYRTALGSVAQRLQSALKQTNQQLAVEAKDQPELLGMGCTLVGVALQAGYLEWISVGDSPLWLYDRTIRQLYRLNFDHSIKPILQEQLQRGLLTLEEVESHPERNMLFSAVTGDSLSLIDQSPEPLQMRPGDCVLLASDGIFTLSEAEMSHILQKDLPAQELVQELLQAVDNKKRSNQDNTTVLVVKLPKSDSSICPDDLDNLD